MPYPSRMLAARNLSPKKYMGQNFLVDPSTAEMIVRRAGVSSDRAAVEVGAGLGALTVPLARCVKTLYAVEKDRDLIQVLGDVLSENGIDNAVLLNRSIFDIPIQDMAKAENSKLILIGNLPYNISSQVVMWAIENRAWIDKGVFMFQKEVADRIAAAPGGREYGRLSVMVQYCARVRKIARINANQFYPKPKVDSEVVEISFEDPVLRPAADETLFAAVVKAAFGQRRKTLKNSMAGASLGLGSRVSACLWEETAINPGRRAETLTVAEFVDLADSLKACLNRFQ